VSAPLTLSDLLQIVAGFERRALELYRYFAQVFAAHPTAGRIWRAMSDAEAGHFAVLRLAEDRLPAVGSTTEVDRRFDEGRLDEWESTIKELEAKGRRPEIDPAEAAEITLTWEREELPRPGRGRRGTSALPERAVKSSRIGSSPARGLADRRIAVTPETSGCRIVF